jgi:hypothetical protein
MITEYEQRWVRLLSDTDLYPQAVAFMRGIGRPLPPTQINGLLNVSQRRVYVVLERFIERQKRRTTWPPKEEQYIPEFYRRLTQKLKELEALAASILKARTSSASREDRQELNALLAREFIQHVLAENAYMQETRRWQPGESASTSNRDHVQRNNRGAGTQQRRS